MIGLYLSLVVDAPADVERAVADATNRVLVARNPDVLASAFLIVMTWRLGQDLGAVWLRDVGQPRMLRIHTRIQNQLDTLDVHDKPLTAYLLDAATTAFTLANTHKRPIDQFRWSPFRRTGADWVLEEASDPDEALALVFMTDRAVGILAYGPAGPAEWDAPTRVVLGRRGALDEAWPQQEALALQEAMALPDGDATEDALARAAMTAACVARVCQREDDGNTVVDRSALVDRASSVACRVLRTSLEVPSRGTNGVYDHDPFSANATVVALCAYAAVGAASGTAAWPVRLLPSAVHAIDVTTGRGVQTKTVFN
jgi:hypothetical protein